jgi:glycosyltransferase involved in cell wall biosynthesis
MHELAVVVPAYQEAPRIAAALEFLLATLRDDGFAPGVDTDVLVVSDGSRDGTPEIAARFADQGIRVHHYTPNRGKGNALRVGCGLVDAELVAFIDADMDLHPHGIRRLVDQLRATGADLVIGSKVHPDSNVAWPWLRRVQSHTYRLLVRSLFRLGVRDTQTGLKVFRSATVSPIVARVTTDGFAFDLEWLVRTNDAGLRIVEGPVELRNPSTTSTGLRAAADVFRETVRIARERRAGWPPPHR